MIGYVKYELCKREVAYTRMKYRYLIVRRNMYFYCSCEGNEVFYAQHHSEFAIKYIWKFSLACLCQGSSEIDMWYLCVILHIFQFLYVLYAFYITLITLCFDCCHGNKVTLYSLMYSFRRTEKNIFLFYCFICGMKLCLNIIQVICVLFVHCFIILFLFLF